MLKKTLDKREETELHVPWICSPQGAYHLQCITKKSSWRSSFIVFDHWLRNATWVGRSPSLSSATSQAARQTTDEGWTKIKAAERKKCQNAATPTCSLVMQRSPTVLLAFRQTQKGQQPARSIELVALTPSSSSAQCTGLITVSTTCSQTLAADAWNTTAALSQLNHFHGWTAQTEAAWSLAPCGLWITEIFSTTTGCISFVKYTYNDSIILLIFAA